MKTTKTTNKGITAGANTVNERNEQRFASALQSATTSMDTVGTTNEQLVSLFMEYLISNQQTINNIVALLSNTGKTEVAPVVTQELIEENTNKIIGEDRPKLTPSQQLLNPVQSIVNEIASIKNDTSLHFVATYKSIYKEMPIDLKSVRARYGVRDTGRIVRTDPRLRDMFLNTAEKVLADLKKK